MPQEQAYVAARCAMWWANECVENHWSEDGEKYNRVNSAFRAWRKLWRELEGMR